MLEFYSFFIILLAVVIFSQVLKRFHVPWVIALIVGGVIIGPFGLDLVTPDPTLNFLKELGLIFLMFVAGFEIHLSGFQESWKKSSFIALTTGLIPLGVGIGIGLYFGYNLIISLLLGIIFISSSIAIAIPLLQKRGLLYSETGKVIVSSTMLQDIASLILLAILLQYTTPGLIPLPIFIVLFALVILMTVAVRWGIPRLRWLLRKKKQNESSFQRDLQIVFIVLIGGVLIFELLGLHSIVGAFLVGLVLSEAIQSELLKEKIHVMAYGLFIPIFFIMVGAETNLGIFLEARGTLILTTIIIFGSMLTKFVSGWLSSYLIGFNHAQSALVGATCIPQLSTTLAVVTIGQQYKLLPPELITTFVILSIVTVMVSASIMSWAAGRVKIIHNEN